MKPRSENTCLLPPDWEWVPLKRVSEVFASNVDKLSVKNEAPVLLCNYTDVYYSDVIEAGRSFMEATATRAEIERFSVTGGDVVFTKDSETANDIGIPAYVPASLSGVLYGYHLYIARPYACFEGSFLRYVLLSRYAKAYMETRANGLTRVGLGYSAVTNLPVPLPPKAEQAAIASFLDRETTTIDALVGEQKRLIELLKEKRQGVISHAVTKGLNPDAPMKPSGVAWLGMCRSIGRCVSLIPLARRLRMGT